MDLPSIDDLKATGLSLTEAIAERARLVERAPPSVRLDEYAARLHQCDVWEQQANCAFESSVAALAGLPYVYDAVVRLYDRKETAMDFVNGQRQEIYRKIEMLEREWV